MNTTELQIAEFSPNALWAMLGCEIERKPLSDRRPWCMARKVLDRLGRVVCYSMSGDGYEHELSIARWLMFGTNCDQLIGVEL